MDLPSRLLRSARQAKHAAYRARVRAGYFGVGLENRAYRAVGALREFHWQPELCPDSPQHGALALPARPDVAEVPRRIFCFWTGDNPLTPNRERCLTDLRANDPEVEVILVTPENLADWIVPEHPLPPAYRDLSFVHRSDYLRCYFMHHHGGGYSDLKSPLNSWLPAFAALEANPQWHAIGYAETDCRGTGRAPGQMGRLLRRNFFRLIGNCAYIFRPGQEFTRRWLASTDELLTDLAPELQANPGGVWGDTPGYPLAWTQLLGDIFHPWNLVHAQYVGQDDRLQPDILMANYR